MKKIVFNFYLALFFSVISPVVSMPFIALWIFPNQLAKSYELAQRQGTISGSVIRALGWTLGQSILGAIYWASWMLERWDISIPAIFIGNIFLLLLANKPIN